METGVWGRYKFGALGLLSCLVCCEACGGLSSTGVSANGGGGTLVLQAYGGPSGRVGADVPLLEPGVGPQETCADPSVAGACQLTSCLFGGIGSPGRGYGNFGPILASVGSTTMPLSYNGVGYPTVYFPPSVTLGMGGTMRFRGGDGAGVPTFDVPATIPGLAVMTSPAPPAADASATIIDTSHDLAVTWLPISIGRVSFGLQGGSWPSGDVTISIACTFEGASGAGAVPHQLLSSFKEMSGTNPAYASMGSGLEASTVVDGLTIVLQSSQNPAPPYHDLNVMLQ